MAIDSCISHPPQTKFVIRRADYMGICGDDAASAELLALFEFLTSCKIADGVSPEECWIEIPIVQHNEAKLGRGVESISAGLLDTYSEKTLRKKLALLEQKGYIKRREKVNSLHHPYSYRFEIPIVQSAINYWHRQSVVEQQSYRVDPVKVPDRKNQGIQPLDRPETPSVVDPVKLPLRLELLPDRDGTFTVPLYIDRSNIDLLNDLDRMCLQVGTRTLALTEKSSEQSENDQEKISLSLDPVNSLNGFSKELKPSSEDRSSVPFSEPQKQTRKRGQTTFRPKHHPNEFAEGWRRYCEFADQVGAREGCPKRAAKRWDEQINAGATLDELVGSGLNAFFEACHYRAKKNHGQYTGIPHFENYIGGSTRHNTPYWRASLDWKVRQEQKQQVAASSDEAAIDPTLQQWQQSSATLNAWWQQGRQSDVIEHLRQLLKVAGCHPPDPDKVRWLIANNPHWQIELDPLKGLLVPELIGSGGKT